MPEQQEVEQASRYIPIAVQREVITRADGRCEECGRGMADAPNWGKSSVLHFHHREQWVDGGPNTTENLQLLCVWCHGSKHTDRMERTALRIIAKEGREPYWGSVGAAVPREQYEEIARLAEQGGCKMADVVRQLIREALLIRELARREKVE